MGRASKNTHRNILAGNGKENQKTMPEHKTKQVATSIPAMKGKSAPLKTLPSHPNC